MREIHKYLVEINEYTARIAREKFSGQMLEPTFGRYLGSFVNVLLYAIRPKTILELGLGSGYVTSILASYATKHTSSVVSIDINKEKTDRAYQALSEYKDNLEIINIDAFDYLKENHKKFDLVVQDSNPVSYKALHPLISRSQVKGGVLLIHDAIVAKMEYCPQDIAKAMREYNYYLSQSIDYTPSLIELEDGLWFCVKN